MSNLIKPDAIHAAVQEHYAQHARTGSTCCDPGCSDEPSFYSLDEITALPHDVATFSLGCGNAVGAAGLREGETVLDLGSGGGLECFVAAQQVGRTGHVIGVDMTPDMLARARASAARMGFANVEFREGYIEALPVDDATVDVIISNCVINLSPDKAAVMREMHRVLKPGGRIAISDVVATAAIPESYQKDMELWSACASGALPVAEWEAGLADAGFQHVRIEARTSEDAYTAMIPEARPFSALIFAEKATPVEAA